MLSILLAAAAVASPAPATTPFDEVVAAERSFAADSPVKGLHDAFLTHLSEDSVVFQPVPTSGIAAHQGKPRTPGVLAWAPAWVAAAGSGNLGFSTGPWEYRPKDPAESPRTGWFFSVWAKQSTGDWKVKADFGVGCPLTYAVPPTVVNGNPGAARAAIATKDLARARARLNAEESRLDRAAESGIGPAVLSHADAGLRAYREGTCPTSGLDAARALLEKDLRKLTCKPQRIELAPSGDLGYAYGSCETREGDPGKTGFLRLWIRHPDGIYRVLADIVAEVPVGK